MGISAWNKPGSCIQEGTLHNNQGSGQSQQSILPYDAPTPGSLCEIRAPAFWLQAATRSCTWEDTPQIYTALLSQGCYGPGNGKEGAGYHK